MSSERRAAAGDEAQEETPVLSDWLAGNLRVSRSEPPAPAKTPSVHPPPEAVEAPTPLDLVAASSPGEPLESPHPSGPFSASDAPEPLLEGDPTEDDEELGAASDQQRETPSTFAPQVMPPDEETPDLEPDPALLFLAQERRVRQRQRITMAVVAAALLLLGGGYLLSRRAATPPAQPAEAAVTPPPAATVAANPAPPPPAENLDVPEPEADEAEPAKVGLPAAIGSPLAPPAKADPNAVPGGPSTARYPDLPRDVLIQLESAASTESKR